MSVFARSLSTGALLVIVSCAAASAQDTPGATEADAALAAFGHVKPDDVIDGFRRGIDIAGHVSWLPGGTQLNGGRLGVMIPVAVGQALGRRARVGEQAWVITHCGDAGWISGQALNGFNGASAHGAPITFVATSVGMLVGYVQMVATFVRSQDGFADLAALGGFLLLTTVGFGAGLVADLVRWWLRRREG